MDKYWRKYYEMEELNFLSENITIEIRPLIKTIDDSSLSLLSVRKFNIANILVNYRSFQTNEKVKGSTLGCC